MPENFLAFALASFALNIVPGPDMTFSATSGARGGVRVGLAAALGIFAGCLVHIAAAVVGLSALIAASAEAFAVLKSIGAAYLLYMAWTLFRAPPAAAEGAAAPALTARQAFRSGALVNILNPKVGLFFLAFIPQFVDPAAASPALTILFFGLWFNSVGTVVNALVAVTAAHTAARFRQNPLLVRLSRWLAGTLMAGLAVQLALARK
jgi:threonine/homoserine/homoserine lactone efflux protein